jgi:hypothetical protein
MSRSGLRGLMSRRNVSASAPGALAYLQRLLAGLKLKNGRTTAG